MNDPALLALGATVLAGTLALAGAHLYASGRARRRALVDRLSGGGAPGPGRTATGRVRRFTALDRRLRRTRLGRTLHMRLSATGLDLSAGEFFAGVTAAVLALWLIAAATLAPFFGPIAALVAVWGAAVFLNWQNNRDYLNRALVPGFAWRPKREDWLTLVVGFPANAVAWRATDRLELAASYIFPRTVYSEVRYRLWKGLRLYAGFDWASQRYFRHDRLR